MTTTEQHASTARSRAGERADRGRRLAAEIFLRVDHALHTRSMSAGTLARSLEDGLKRPASSAWRFVKRRPSVGVALAGAAGLALASSVGVGELVVAVSAAYAAYQVLRQGVAPAAAVKEALGLVEEA